MINPSNQVWFLKRREEDHLKQLKLTGNMGRFVIRDVYLVLFRAKQIILCESFVSQEMAYFNVPDLLNSFRQKDFNKFRFKTFEFIR